MANKHYRNRDLLDLAYAVPCMIRLSCCAGGDAGMPCHSNNSEHGKGGSIKAHDCFYASGCDPCHRELDQGRSMTHDEKANAWRRAHDATMLYLWQNGYIGVIRKWNH